MSWIKKVKEWMRPTPCECGNRESCNSKYGFLVLYDIVGDGIARLNPHKARQCTRFYPDIIEMSKQCRIAAEGEQDEL